MNESQSQVIAKVDSHKIFLNEFKSRYEDFLISSGSKDNYNARKGILNNLISEFLLYNIDNNENIFRNPDYQKELKWNIKQGTLAFLKDREIYAKINVTDEEIRTAFLRVNEFISARHLFSTSEEEAEGFYKMLIAGISFEALAQTVFTDSILRNNGGYLGYFTWGDMEPNFEETAFSLKIGEISKPIKTAYGYSVIKLEDRKPHPILTESEFQRKRNHIENILKIKKKKPAEKKFISDLMNRKIFKFNDKILEQLVKRIKSYSSIGLEKNISQSSNEFCLQMNEKKWTATEIEKKLFQIPKFHLEKITTTKKLKNTIEGIFLQDTLLFMAKEKRYDQNEIVIDAISKLNAKTFMTYKLNEIVKNSIFSDSAIFDFYIQNIQLYSTENEVNLQQITVADLSLANDLFSSAKKGIDFTSLFRKFSLSYTSKNDSGIIGFVPLSRLGKSAEQIWNSSVGDIIGPFKIDKNFSILKIIDRKKSRPISFNSIKEFVIETLKKNNMMNSLHEHIKTLQSKVKIEIDEKLLLNFNLEKNNN